MEICRCYVNNRLMSHIKGRPICIIDTRVTGNIVTNLESYTPFMAKHKSLTYKNMAIICKTSIMFKFPYLISVGLHLIRFHFDSHFVSPLLFYLYNRFI